MKIFVSMATLFITFSVTFSADALAQQFGEPRRISVPPKYPISAVGKLLHRRGWCTAFMVSECTLATNAHCVEDGKTRDSYAPYTFIASDGTRFGLTKVDSRPIKRGLDGRAIDYAREGIEIGHSLDVAFAQLTLNSIAVSTRRYGAFELGGRTPEAMVGHKYCVYGFDNSEEGKRGAGTLDPDVEVHRPFGESGLFFHMANNSPGGSGSPIFRCAPKLDATGKKLIDIGIGKLGIADGIAVSAGHAPSAFDGKMPIHSKEKAREMPLAHMPRGLAAIKFRSSLDDYENVNPCPKL